VNAVNDDRHAPACHDCWSQQSWHAGRIADALGERLGRREITPIPDGELQIELLESVPQDGQHLLALLLLATACRRDGAALRTAILPLDQAATEQR
jgi:phosphoribosylpyrophosphate synthetase